MPGSRTPYRKKQLFNLFKIVQYFFVCGKQMTLEFLIKIRWHHLLKYFFVSAAPEAVAGNVVGLDDLPLTDQCRGVAVDQLHHPEDEGLAQPLVRIKTEAEVNLKTILWFLFFWHAKCILSCLSCSRSFCHYYFVLHTYRVSIKQYTIHFLLNKRLRLAAAMYSRTIYY